MDCDVKKPINPPPHVLRPKRIHETTSKKTKLVRDESDYAFFHGRNYSNCLEYAKDCLLTKNMVITFVEIRNEEVPRPLFEAKGLEWQIWRKDYGEVLKHYWINDLLDKRVRVWDNSLETAPEGFTRLYRAIPAKDLPQARQPMKAKAFVKKAPPKGLKND